MSRSAQKSRGSETPARAACREMTFREWLLQPGALVKRVELVAPFERRFDGLADVLGFDVAVEIEEVGELLVVRTLAVIAADPVQPRLGRARIVIRGRVDSEIGV